MARSMAERGYDRAHWQLRAQVKRLVEAGGARCSICGQPIAPAARWDLDHTPDRSAYRGPAHSSCNRADGARRGNRMRGLRRHGFTSEAW